MKTESELIQHWGLIDPRDDKEALLALKQIGENQEIFDTTVSMSVYWAAVLKTTLVTELFGDPNAGVAGCEDQEKVALESVPGFPLSVKDAPAQ